MTEVETRYTYLERLVEELSRVMHDQQRAIDALAVRLKHLETLVDETADPASEHLPHEKPPHY